MKQIQSKKCKEDFNLLKSRVYNDYPLCKKLKKQTKKHYQKPTPKPKHRTKQPRLSKCFIFPGTKRPELSTLQRLSMDIPIKANKNTFSDTRKKESARGTVGRGKGGNFSLFPLPIVLHALSLSVHSPQLPYDTKRPRRRRERHEDSATHLQDLSSFSPS